MPHSSPLVRILNRWYDIKITPGFLLSFINVPTNPSQKNNEKSWKQQTEIAEAKIYPPNLLYVNLKITLPIKGGI